MWWPGPAPARVILAHSTQEAQGNVDENKWSKKNSGEEQLAEAVRQDFGAAVTWKTTLRFATSTET